MTNRALQLLESAANAVKSTVGTWLRELGRFNFAVVCIAALCISVMYCANDSFDADPSAARGDGHYRPILARGDGHMHFLVTRSIVFDQDFDFDNDLARFGDPWNQPLTVTGRKNVMQQIGPSLIWAPILAFAHGMATVANLFGAGIATHGYTLFHQRILFASSPLFACLAIFFGIAAALRLGCSPKATTWAAVAILLGTSLTYYATYMPSYAHAMDAVACAAFLGFWAKTIGDVRWRRYVVLGVLLGIATMIRIQDAAFGIVLALELVMSMLREWRAKHRAEWGLLGRGAFVLLITAILFTPQLYVWKQMYGSWITTPQGPGQMRYAHPMIAELLFSSRNGWFSNTPLAYLGTIGLLIGAIAGPRLHSNARLICAAMLLVIAGQIYCNAVTYEWWSGASFGQRRMCSVTLPLVVGLAILLRTLTNYSGRRVYRYARYYLCAAIIGYLVVWNLAWVSRLRHGVAAGRDRIPTCCDDVPAPLSWVARPVYSLVGNPFEFPANAIFALRHGVGLSRWDRAVDAYPLVPPVLGYLDGSYRRATAPWNIAGPGGDPFLLDGWAPSQSDSTSSWRWTVEEHAEALVPILMPEPHRIAIPIAANVRTGDSVMVTISCNGRQVARARVGADWTTIVFDTDGSIGDNVISIDAPVGPYIGGPPAPRAVPNVGVAIRPWRVALPPQGQPQ